MTVTWIATQKFARKRYAYSYTICVETEEGFLQNAFSFMFIFLV